MQNGGHDVWGPHFLLTVDDKNIELGTVAVPSDATADGGGITLKGATDKTILWENDSDSWDFSEHINAASGKEFKINNSSVLIVIFPISECNERYLSSD